MMIEFTSAPPIQRSFTGGRRITTSMSTLSELEFLLVSND